MNPSPQLFLTSPQALARRRRLVRQFQVTALTAGALALLLEAWIPAAFALALPALLRPRSWLDRYASRELRLQPQALEEKNGKFTRFMLYEDIIQLRMIQGPKEEVLALEIRGPKGGFSLHGYESMETVFAEMVRLKPEKVIVEVEVKRWVI